MQPNPVTIQDALLDATRALGATMTSHDARLQAELLLAHALETTRSMVLARLNETIPQDSAARYAANVARRAAHEPLAYILGHQEFYGLDFLVDRRVLIPRHETETLIQLALDRARAIVSPVIVDVGTGSGAIALTLAHHLPGARVIALDVSPDALEVARMNAQRMNLQAQVEFVESDLMEQINKSPVSLRAERSNPQSTVDADAASSHRSTTPLRGSAHDAPRNDRVNGYKSFDILVANLPYILNRRFAQLPAEVREHEPRLALDGGEDGLDIMRRLLSQMETRAARGAIALLEISEEQGNAAMELASQVLPNAVTRLHRDLEGMERVMEIQKMKEDR